MLKADPATDKREPIVIKKYANRRLYNTETSTYVTLEDLAAMVRSDRDFVVYDAKSGEELTHSVLTQIIVEQEAKSGGQMLLPVPFLRQLIRFYDDAIAKMVPTYLQFSMENLVKEQARLREQFAPMFQQYPFSAAAFEAIQQQTRKNAAMFEQALNMWAPFAVAKSAANGNSQGPGENAANAAEENRARPTSDELAELKAEFARMQAKIEQLTKGRE